MNMDTNTIIKTTANCKHKGIFLKVFLTLIIFIYVSNFALAQVGSVKGKVTDAKTHETIPGVSLFVLPVNLDLSSRENGEFLIRLNPGEYTLQVRSMGYTTQEKRFTITNTDPAIVNMELQPTAIEMSTIVVSAGKFEQKLDEVVVSMEVLKAAQIENSNQNTMETAVEKVPD